MQLTDVRYKYTKIRHFALTYLSLLTVFIGTAQKTYYVSLTGDDSNSGLSQKDSWRTITYAASLESPVLPGDVVYIKAGNYGNENVVFETDGTARNQITFEGYLSSPGDSPKLNWNYGDNLNPNVMPLLDGGDRTCGIGITLNNRKYINLKNIQISNYEIGLYALKTYKVNVNNIVAMYFGDVNEDYHGKGIAFGWKYNQFVGSHNTIENCIVFNACAEGLSAYGNNNRINNCRIYSDDNSTGHKSAMDYYIHVGGNNNIIENCYVERIGDLKHNGHGIDLKRDCENNIIRNCVAKNMKINGYELRHRGVRNNLIINCKAINCGYTVRDGASNNTIRNCVADGADSAILFFDTTEDEGAQYAGRYNVFENCIFRNTKENVIKFFHYNPATLSIIDNNTFMNCVFDGGEYLINADRENIDNKMVNCIVTNVQNYSRSTFFSRNPLAVNFNFEYSNFWNNGFENPKGLKIYSFDPLFVDVNNGNYRLESESPCIGLGTSSKAPRMDFDGNLRNKRKIDIGPFQYKKGIKLEKK
ncbi:right-handed parallel beta-helix repeat-containing protein [Aquimarina brevivitae]|uniref:Parallel beta helix pectate lyase-like protein n=1 Tax=Aquimarina brevivitae TaxID=323412 RepID=A0A4Q7PFM5_9FLAO|nr:right-handed parallel beta-helix repeat-containing protein [Aquimarina brevivitae]RZS99303.1 parallel beta helix pectate lyase-like protein [Aquimarina brevivitae]